MGYYIVEMILCFAAMLSLGKTLDIKASYLDKAIDVICCILSCVLILVIEEVLK